jgi:hypothetical protein
MGKEAYQTYDIVKGRQTFFYVNKLSLIHIQGMNKDSWRIATSSDCKLLAFH